MLSDYERARAERILKNRDVMQRLGLLDSDVFQAAEERSEEGSKAPSKKAKSAKRREGSRGIANN